jgi:hypothetical protein
VWRRLVPLIATAVLDAAPTSGVWCWQRPAVPPQPVTRFTLSIPEGQQFNDGGLAPFAISRDGTQIRLTRVVDGAVGGRCDSAGACRCDRARRCSPKSQSHAREASLGPDSEDPIVPTSVRCLALTRIYFSSLVSQCRMLSRNV